MAIAVDFAKSGAEAAATRADFHFLRCKGEKLGLTDT
jgi:hypothetical protein